MTRRFPEDDADLAEARRIVLQSLGPHRVKVFLFGSRAWGEPGRASDIDVGVLPDAPLPDDALSALREALEESHIPYHVDVVDLSRASPGLRERVLREGVPWSA